MIMARKRIEMRQIREILRLRHKMNLSYEQIGRSLRISKRTVEQYIDRANKAQINWPIPEEIDDDQWTYSKIRTRHSSTLLKIL